MVIQRGFRLRIRFGSAFQYQTPPLFKTTAQPLRAVLLLLALMLISPRLLADSFTASVDRSRLAEQETLQLTLSHDPQIIFGSPDLTTIKQDFDIVQGPNRMNSMRSVNGDSSSRTEWTMTLVPKRTGTLTIPAIEFKGERSQPLTIRVDPLSSSIKEQDDKYAFFDIQLDQQSERYVQGQILYTEKLYYRVNHRDANLSDLDVEDARVEMLGEPKQYTSMLNGERVGVYERRYVIYPEKAGKLVIPGQRFQAVGIVQNSGDPWGGKRTMISAVTRPLELEILPIPATYPTAPWLPAHQLSLTEQFSADPEQWQVGEPITRTLTINTERMSASQIVLPDLPQPTGLKQYPDQSEYHDDVSDNGISGQFQQAVAMVPTVAGKVILPEVRIPWWNTQSNQLQYATLPARTLTVLPNPAHTSTNPPTGGNTLAAAGANYPQTASAQAQSGQPVANSTDGMAASHRESIHGINTTGLIGWILALILLCTNLLTLYWWRRRNRRPSAPTNGHTAGGLGSWSSLTTACNQGNTRAIRTALLAWLHHEMADTRIQRLDQLAEHAHDPQLATLLQQLDASLYAPVADNARFDGKQLHTRLDNWRKQQGMQGKAPDHGLNDSLYPA
tara:strand:- start:2835 stop:4685 length:1851 start_codon:yes stop_codon:yes gene_type:complete